ncbi:MAG: hypothetical protein RL434_478 [Pseudomonadota bacterium]
MANEVLIEEKASVLWLTLNRPGRRNAINEAVCAGLSTALADAERARHLRAVVITGAGDEAFCAGGDLSPDAKGAPFEFTPADPRHYALEMFQRLEACRLPLVARVNGTAVGGGLGLICACDIAIAADHARFGLPEARFGIFPMMVLPYLMRLVPRRRLTELCLTGEMVDANEALRLNLLNHVVPGADLDRRVDECLERLLANSPTSHRVGKQVLRAIGDMHLEQALEYTQVMLPVIAQTEDAREGMAAFNARRPPRWTGR